MLLSQVLSIELSVLLAHLWNVKNVQNRPKWYQRCTKMSWKNSATPIWLHVTQKTEAINRHQPNETSDCSLFDMLSGVILEG